MTSEIDVWTDLRRLTAARIGLRRAGASLATRDMLDFQLAHARARDAVHAPLDETKLAADLSGLGLPIISLASAAADRQTYLMRPDLGRCLAVDAATALAAHRGAYDVAFVIADGLSAQAVQRHAPPLLALAIHALRAETWQIAPLVIVRHGRVAIGDAVATALSAKCAVVLIGERPGLSAPDSMGAYLTWRPNAQTTDAERNCISNIRPEGIDYDTAAFRLTHLLRTMRTAGLSGIALKDDSDRLLLGGKS
ncbi:MAG TPA: ethanolamine ammonia-lyase subunit EutC [Xanthobacteraceae bacterium]|jgi:ethanolamine ammonia-lyase small subunit|nr:ethanolamine ammonia-lyase subunit EutC [Xanthobacteraceae bacterium]